MSLAHRPKALLASLEPFARHKVNLLKTESRPIPGRPWEYQFFMDVESERPGRLELALAEVRDSTTEIRVLGLYAAGKTN
jgi:prephenate dehydratase